MNTTTQSKEKPAPVVLPVDLRDYFAAKAMAAFLAEPVAGQMEATVHEFDKDTAVIFAKSAYLMAEAMLKAREE